MLWKWISEIFSDLFPINGIMQQILNKILQVQVLDVFLELTACVNTKNIFPLLIALSLMHLLFTLCQQDVNQGMVQMTNICLFLLYIIYRFRQVQVMHS